MRDHPLDYSTLHQFSQRLPYTIATDEQQLLVLLDQVRVRLNFPAITNDVGCLLRLILRSVRPQKIFEFGSGYGHSLFWYLGLPGVQKVVLTEKRTDLLEVFHNLPWPGPVKQITEYWQGDAFERFEADDEQYDFILLDGVKASYQKFLQLCQTRVSVGGVIAIDNSFWRGSFLLPPEQQNSSAKAIAELHQYISNLNNFEKVFVPHTDGLTLLYRIS